MRRRVSTTNGTNGAKPNNSATGEPKIHSSTAGLHRTNRIGMSIIHVHAGDGIESGTVIVTCPFCTRSLPLDENTVSKHFAHNAIDRPMSTPSLSSAGSSLLPAPLPFSQGMPSNNAIKISVARTRGLTRTIASSKDQIPISTIMTRDIVCVRPDLSAEAVTTLLIECGLEGAPVVDAEGELVGFISMTDLVRNEGDNSETKESIPLRVPTRSGGSYELGSGFHATEIARATAGELMNPVVISLEESAPVTMAAALMAFNEAHRIVVVSEDRKVVGILTALDVLRWLAQEDGYPIPNAAPLQESHPCVYPRS